jgi:hypothetical protein
MAMASTEDVAARIGARPLDESSSPSTTEVSAWIDEAEAELIGTLESVGLATSFAANSRGSLVCRAWISAYVAGLVRRAHAASGGDGANADGQREIDDWRARIQRIVTSPAEVGAVLGGGSGPSSTTRVSSHVIDPAVGRTDFTPRYSAKRWDA